MASAVLGLLEWLALQALDGRSRQNPFRNFKFRNYLTLFPIMPYLRRTCKKILPASMEAAERMWYTFSK